MGGAIQEFVSLISDCDASQLLEQSGAPVTLAKQKTWVLLKEEPMVLVGLGFRFSSSLRTCLPDV